MARCASVLGMRRLVPSPSPHLSHFLGSQRPKADRGPSRMLQGVRSSCPRPVCSLRSEPRSAARSRSQQVTRGAASPADKGLESYSQLQLALDNLEKSLRAPRINRAVAQVQMQLVAADAAWWAADLDRELSMTQHKAALAVADNEIVLLELRVSAHCCCAALPPEVGQR